MGVPFNGGTTAKYFPLTRDARLADPISIFFYSFYL